VRTRLEEATRAYNDHGRCLVCEMLEEERRQSARVVLEGQEVTALVPYASFSPYSVWIIPHHHRSCFSEAGDDELDDLAGVLRDLLARFYRGLKDPDYNLVLRSVASHVAARYFHWYLALVPRLGKAAGFELGTGMFINSNLPEEDARLLRGL
jgi:UDPglucose--hexose-1-phosphate uridylyltransferase